jgi:hypothetical protein
MGEDLFPSIVETLKKYLCINILNAIKIEIAQCLYLQVILISPSELELNQEQV